MDSRRPINYKRQPSRQPLERRLDKWIETGRQFVDGVAGTRPGQRKSTRSERRSGSNLNNVGRWVGEKIDWLFEDEEDWSESTDPLMELTEQTPLRKRPLTAISLRVPKALEASSQANTELDQLDQWPDDDAFRIEKWDRERSQKTEINDFKGSLKNVPSEKNTPIRPLPRSSRRRN